MKLQCFGELLTRRKKEINDASLWTWVLSKVVLCYPAKCGPSTTARLTVKCVGVPPCCTLRHMCSVCPRVRPIPVKIQPVTQRTQIVDFFISSIIIIASKGSCHLYRNRPNSLIFFSKNVLDCLSIYFPDKLACSCGIEMSRRPQFLIAQWTLPR